MNAQSVTCPSGSMLTDFSLGKLDVAQAETISQHLETCAECRQRVAGVTGDSFVERLKQAGNPPSVRRERTYVPGESLANVANSTDGSSVNEDGLSRPSRTTDDMGKHGGLRRPPHEEKDRLGSLSSAPPILANHPDYELIKEIGQGGMGTVYLAKNRMMDRMEVLKVISKSLLDRPGALERFQQEIRSAAMLAHPNIVAAYQVLRLDDSLVFAMEHVPGRDLGQVVKDRGYLPVVNAALYGQQVALGLQHAFEKGMVHRDIKPHNLMLAVEGKKHVVKILDFGLARATSEKDAMPGLTQSGQMLGTPDFIAPEQILDAHKADIRADIYSLGCTLYFLLSGSPPFQATSLYQVLEAHHKREAKPLNLVRPDVPMELAAVVAKMMAKDPAKRFQTPLEVAKALVPFFKPGRGVATALLNDATHSPSTGDTAHGFGALTPISPTPPSPSPIPRPAPPAAVLPPSPLPAVEACTPTARRRSGWSSLPPWQRYAAAAGAAPALLLGIVLLIRTPKGSIEIELNDLDAKVDVAVDGDRIDLAGLDKPLSLVVGDHGLKVTGEGYETITKQFSVTRGRNAPLTVKLVPLPRLAASAPPLAVAPFDAKQARAHQEAWAEYLGVPVEQTNSIGMKLVLIPPGEFVMGSPKTEIDRLVGGYNDAQFQRHFRSEGPQHSVKLTAPFYLSACEVTQQQYEGLMGVNRSHFSAGGAAKGAVQGQDTSRHPVEMVNWFDAIEFCNKLSEREHLRPQYARDGKSVQLSEGTAYRLPKEAEWEYSCRAGTITLWSAGDDWRNLGNVAWFRRNSDLRTHPVGELVGNHFGLFDQHGNVWEWCWDGHGEYAAEAVSDPTNLPAGAQRVLRGGAWNDAYNWARSAFRGWGDPGVPGGNIGFRVAMSVEIKNGAAEPGS
jgi:serine/threonine protein kinase/formylglycine-generating enzyme required for sulfatase activity